MKTKILLSILYLSTLAGYVLAQIPGFNYQAVLRSVDGEPVPNADVKIFFNLTDGPDGAVLYRESQSLTTNELGMVNTVVGTGTVEMGSFADIVSVENLNIKLQAEIPGEPNIVDVGFGVVGAVPYALYGEDADADPENEMQSLSVDGDSLKLSGMPGVSLEGIASPFVKVDSGFTLDLEASNQRSLVPVNRYGLYNSGLYVNGNGIRTLYGASCITRNFGGSTVSENYGTFVSLRTRSRLGDLRERALGGDDVIPDETPAYEKTSGNHYTAAVGDENMAFTAHSGPYGAFYSYSTNSQLDKGLIRQGSDHPQFHLSCSDDAIGLDINANDGFAAGAIAINNEGNQRGAATYGGTFSTANDDGLTTLTGFLPGSDPTNAVNVLFNGANLGVLDNINTESAATTSTYGANGQTNTTSGTFAGAPDHGVHMVFGDAGGSPTAYMRSTATGSEVAANILTMLSAAPGRSDRDATFAAPMGGEAAAYDRGTAQMINGEATVVCPEHFQWVADEASMTVTITPLSAESKGVAVIEKSNGGFKVKELHGGTGNYAFDYLVMCKRKGYENFEVLRKKPEMAPTHDQKILDNLPKGPINSIRDLAKRSD
ncbi:MAG: hypothetical protein HKN87_07725 [Saprospiraceae bacterium]|nr:hypothetical protein [Saprospiraceae bacterium]